MIKIESATNPRLRTWRSLLTGRGLRKNPSFILSGEQLVREFLKKPNLEIESLITPETWSEPMGELPIRRQAQLSQKLFDELDSLGTHFPLLILKQPKLEVWDQNQAPGDFEILCPLGDPQNLGALVRTAEAFGAGPVVLLKQACHPFHPKSVKASAGAVLRHPLKIGPSITEIKQDCIALDLGEQKLNSYSWPKSIRVLIGEEGAGVPESFQGQRLSVSINPKTESLNATVAMSLALYSYRLMHPAPWD